MIVGITGASGTVYGIRVLEMLRTLKIESHLVIFKAGNQTRSVLQTAALVLAGTDIHLIVLRIGLVRWIGRCPLEKGGAA